MYYYSLHPSYSLLLDISLAGKRFNRFILFARWRRRFRATKKRPLTNKFYFLGANTRKIQNVLVFLIVQKTKSKTIPFSFKWLSFWQGNFNVVIAVLLLYKLNKISRPFLLAHYNGLNFFCLNLFRLFFSIYTLALIDSQTSIHFDILPGNVDCLRWHSEFSLNWPHWGDSVIESPCMCVYGSVRVRHPSIRDFVKQILLSGMF